MSKPSSASTHPSTTCSITNATSSLQISFSSLLPHQLIHIVTFLTLREEMQIEQTNHSHRSLLHFGPAHTTSSSSTSSSSTSSSSSSQLQQAHSHHRRIRVDEIMHSLALYCGPISATSSSSSTSSLSSSIETSSSDSFAATQQLQFWNRGPGWCIPSISAFEFDHRVDYDYMRPEWLIPTQCGIVITRDMIACQIHPEAELRTPINVVGIGLAVEEEVERLDPGLAEARQATTFDTSGSGHAVNTRDTVSTGYLNGLTQLRQYQQQQQQSNADHLTLGQVGVQLAQKSATAYETEMREALRSWSSSELRYLLHALNQCSILHAAFDAESVELDFKLPIPNSIGRFYSWSDTPDVTPEFVRVKADFDTLRKPMFVLCRWSSPLTGSQNDARPADVPPRVKGFTWSWDVDSESWMEKSYVMKHLHSSHPKPPPFYPPILEDEYQEGIEPSGGVDVESSELRLAQLSTLLHECPWPFLTDSYEFYMRLSGECRVAAIHLIESCLSIPPHISKFVRITMRTLEQGPRGAVQTFRDEYGTDNGAGWQRVIKPKNNEQQHISASLCELLTRTLPGAFRVAYGSAHFAPYQELIMAPIAPGWVLAMVGGGRTDDSI